LARRDLRHCQGPISLEAREFTIEHRFGLSAGPALLGTSL